MIVEHPEIAAYYTQIFLDDWNASKADDAPGPDRRKIVAAACILIGLLALYLYRRERA